jgi:hypothetical protein
LLDNYPDFRTAFALGDSSVSEAESIAKSTAAGPDADGRKLARQNRGARVQSGAYAKKTASQVRASKIRRTIEYLRKVCPWLQQSDLPALRMYAELEIIGVQLFAALVDADGTFKVTSTGDDGQVIAKRLIDDHRKNRLAANALANALGLTPLARRQIKSKAADDAVDIVGEMARAETGSDQ